MADALKGFKNGKLYFLKSKENINDAPADAVYTRKNGEWVKADGLERTLVSNYPISNSDFSFITYFNSRIYKKLTLTITGTTEVKLFNFDTMEYVSESISSSCIVNVTSEGYIEIHGKGTGTLSVKVEV